MQPVSRAGATQFPADARQYVQELFGAPPEGPEVHGLVYEQYADGRDVVLRQPGQTQPGGAPDIPQDAVCNNRVVLVVDGIRTSLNWQHQEIQHLFLGHGPQEDNGADVGQPVIAIHQGVSQGDYTDLLRVNHDSMYLKALQGHLLPHAWVARRVYRLDPAVKALHDELSQSLQAGRDVQMVTHSGGGAEAALALTLLSGEGYRDAIRDHVRLLSLASGAAHQDFTRAGVKPENLYYTGSVNDPVWRLSRHFVHPLFWPANLPYLVELARVALHLKQTDMAYHAESYISAQSGDRIRQFLAGAPGGVYPLS